MGPLEILWAMLVGVFAAVGIIRGYPKELGVTTTILVALLILTRWGDEILKAIDSFLMTFTESSILFEGPVSDMIQSSFYILIFIIIVFISYHGETLAFAGTPPKGPFGVALNLISGLLNGYLISGTMWYYLHIFNYPFQMVGLFQPQLTEFAQTYLVPLIPVPLLEPYLLFLVPFMIVMRILR